MLKISLLFKKNTNFKGELLDNSYDKKLSGYYFHVNLNIWGDFQICISLPLIKVHADISSFWMMLAKVLTLKDPIISERCIEIEIELNVYFHTSLW